VAATHVPVNTTNNVPDTVFSVLEQEQPLVSDMALAFGKFLWTSKGTEKPCRW